MEQLVQSARTGKRNGLRDAALIVLCYDLGLRIGEATQLRWRNLDLQTGMVRLHSGEKVLGERAWSLLLQLVNQGQCSRFVFAAKKNKPLSTRAARQIISQAAKLGQVSVSVHPDMLVYTRCLQLAAAGKSAEEIAVFLGHSTLKAAERAIKQVSGWREDESGLVGPFVLLGLKKNRQVWRIQVPASTCNLGPGLDTIGLAVTSYARLEFRKRRRGDGAFLRLDGALASKSSDKDQGDLIYSVLKKVWKNTPEILSEMQLSVAADVPLGSGLGISGTVILGALWASYVLKDRIPNSAQLLRESIAIEGHPETLAASLLGGLVVSGLSSDGTMVLTEKLAWPSDWGILAIVPPYNLNTPLARAVLPKEVSLADAIFNMQRTSLFLAAVSNHDAAMLKQVLSEDRLHEPFRHHLVPQLRELRRELADEDTIGCVLSGAGSSVLVLVHARDAERIKSGLIKWRDRKSIQYRLLDLQCDSLGLRHID